MAESGGDISSWDYSQCGTDPDQPRGRTLHAWYSQTVNIGPVDPSSLCSEHRQREASEVHGGPNISGFSEGLMA